MFRNYHLRLSCQASLQMYCAYCVAVREENPAGCSNHGPDLYALTSSLTLNKSFFRLSCQTGDPLRH